MRHDVAPVAGDKVHGMSKSGRYHQVSTRISASNETTIGSDFSLKMTAAHRLSPCKVEPTPGESPEKSVVLFETHERGQHGNGKESGRP